MTEDSFSHYGRLHLVDPVTHTGGIQACLILKASCPYKNSMAGLTCVASKYTWTPLKPQLVEGAFNCGRPLVQPLATCPRVWHCIHIRIYCRAVNKVDTKALTNSKKMPFWRCKYKVILAVRTTIVILAFMVRQKQHVNNVNTLQLLSNVIPAKKYPQSIPEQPAFDMSLLQGVGHLSMS